MEKQMRLVTAIKRHEAVFNAVLAPYGYSSDTLVNAITEQSLKSPLTIDNRGCVSVCKASQMLGVSRSTIVRYLAKGLLRSRKTSGKNGHHLIPVTELERYLNGGIDNVEQ